MSAFMCGLCSAIVLEALCNERGSTRIFFAVVFGLLGIFFSIAWYGASKC
jgi:hypothetical protein